MSPATASSLSTGPRTETGKQTSSQNAFTHGLTSKSPILPSEDPAAYEAYKAAYFNLYCVGSLALNVPFADSVNELSGIRWRLARVAAVEADLIALEVHELITNSDHAEAIAGLELRHLQALAFKRLIESRVLSNLHNQEARLSRRAAKIEDRLEEIYANYRTNSAPHPRSVDRPIPTQQSKRQNEPNATHAAPSAIQPVSVMKAGRNETCPCGSGLKFKRCCLGQPLAATLTAAA